MTTIWRSNLLYPYCLQVVRSPLSSQLLVGVLFTKKFCLEGVPCIE